MAITEKMKQLYYELAAETLEAGNDYTKVTIESSTWSLDGEQHGQIFSVDKDNKSDLWREGE